MIAELEAACEVPRPTEMERLFLNWTEAAEMLRGGMSIGSHTHTHAVLAKLPMEKQIEELATSRRILEENLGRTIDTLSYPVGGPTAFSKTTMRAATEAGYKGAFSDYGGFNHYTGTDPLDIRRNPIDDTALFRFRFQLALGASTGRYWV